MNIIYFIPRGKQNAISRADLRNRTGLPDRLMRESIETARRNGHIILNMQDGRGYYRPSNPPTPEEINDMVKQYKQDDHRAKSVLVRQKFLRRILQQSGRQV